MAAGNYSDPVLAKIISVLNAEGPAALKGKYYQGDPVQVVNKSFLPAAFVTRDRTQVSNISNAEDESKMPIAINVVYDLTRDFNQAFNNISSSVSVYEWIEARNADYTLRDDSILYVLRKYQQLDRKLWINLSAPLEAHYGIGLQKRGPGIFSVEGIIRLEIIQHQIRPGMQIDGLRTTEDGSYREVA